MGCKTSCRIKLLTYCSDDKCRWYVLDYRGYILVEDIKNLIREARSFTCSYCPHSANIAAHTLAKFAISWNIESST